MANRKRDRAITIRMTDKEYRAFMSAFKKSGAKSQTDFLLRLMEASPIIVIEDLAPALVELRRQGNNLNQIARSLHEGYYFMRQDVLKVLDSCQSAYLALLEMKEHGIT